jgi:hypothetical protein
VFQQCFDAFFSFFSLLFYSDFSYKVQQKPYQQRTELSLGTAAE